MASSTSLIHFIIFGLVLLVMSSGPVSATYSSNTELSGDFYSRSCPSALSIVRSVVKKAVKKEKRMAASLLRLHFHDCFVQGCDGSVLLDDTATFKGEKDAAPNVNSLRGFDVVDDMKAALEEACPGVVSCADILAIAARDSVSLVGGPSWTVLLGRRDSTTASATAPLTALPSPTDPLDAIVAKFNAVGLDELDVATLSGAHTIGRGRCFIVSPRLYNFSGTGQPDPTIQHAYLKKLQTACPVGGNPSVVVPMDPITKDQFDNKYFNDLQASKGLFSSDQELLSTSGASTIFYVNDFAADQKHFFSNFAASMVKMGNISPLTGGNGQIRTNCRLVNSS